MRNPNGSSDEPPKVFSFDHVFAPDSKQLDIYNLIARPIVDAVLEGYNGTVFAYGQTGTGKTWVQQNKISMQKKKFKSYEDEINVLKIPLKK